MLQPRLEVLPEQADTNNIHIADSCSLVNCACVNAFLLPVIKWYKRCVGAYCGQEQLIEWF